MLMVMTPDRKVAGANDPEGMKPVRTKPTPDEKVAVDKDPQRKKPVQQTPPQKPAAKVLAREHGSGRWRIEGNQLLQEVASVDLAWLQFGEASWTDYDVTVDAQRIRGRELCCVVFRCQDLLNYWFFGAGREQVNREAVSRDQGICQQLLKEPWGPDDSWHTIGVTVRGSDIQCFMDRERVFAFSDQRHRAGYVALATLKTATRFRELRVTDPRGRALIDGVRTLHIASGKDPMPASHGIVNGATFEGDYSGDDGYNTDVKVKILERDGAKFKGEYWFENSTKRVCIEGDVDARGNISWRVTKILTPPLPEALLDTLVMGTIKNERIYACGYFHLPRLVIGKFNVRLKK
jgi:hypothetical protein